MVHVGAFLYWVQLSLSVEYEHTQLSFIALVLWFWSRNSIMWNLILNARPILAIKYIRDLDMWWIEISNSYPPLLLKIRCFRSSLQKPLLVWPPWINLCWWRFLSKSCAPWVVSNLYRLFVKRFQLIISNGTITDGCYFMYQTYWGSQRNPNTWLVMIETFFLFKLGSVKMEQKIFMATWCKSVLISEPFLVW